MRIWDILCETETCSGDLHYLYLISEDGRYSGDLRHLYYVSYDTKKYLQAAHFFPRPILLSS